MTVTTVEAMPTAQHGAEEESPLQFAQMKLARRLSLYDEVAVEALAPI